MVFSSPTFLFVFLPACLAAVFMAAVGDVQRQRHGGLRPVLQNLVLLAFSVVFYLFGSGWQLALMLAAVGCAWLGGLLAEAPRTRTAGLWVGVGGQIAILLWFKYANFAVAQLGALGVKVTWDAIVLPVGVSFYVFQGVSYVFDVARGAVRARRNPLDLALFITLFPQLIAGPIVRYADLDAEIDRRSPDLDHIATGAVRFVYGLAKKVIVADACAAIADASFGLPPTSLTTTAAWFGIVAYTFQIYFDFSAYSDMAIGLGRMLGFTFPENFARPLSATTMTDFWRRWHLTLSTWFRDYVYLPLGGSRGGALMTARNLWIVFLLSGLWHGAAWTFVVWGALHGLLLSIERVTGTATTTHPRLRRALTFLTVALTFTVFRADDIDHAGRMMRAAFMVSEVGAPLPIPVFEALTHKNVALLLLATASLALPGDFVTGRWLTLSRGPVVAAARVVVMTALAFLALMTVMSQQFSPFIYFRF